MTTSSTEAGLLYRCSNTLGNLFAALAKAQAEFSSAKTEGFNPHFKSRYATLESTIEATRDGLAKNELAIVQMPGNYGDNVAVTTILGHSSGEWIESVVYVAPAKFDAQSLGSVITYLRRYGRAAITGIAPEDDDGEAAVAKPRGLQDRGKKTATPERDDTALAIANEAASRGTEELVAFWKSITPKARDIVCSYYATTSKAGCPEALKKRAAEADENIQKEEDAQNIENVDLNKDYAEWSR